MEDLNTQKNRSVDSVTSALSGQAPENKNGNPEQMLEELLTDPVGFVQQIVDSSAQMHLADLKDEAELNGALKSARQAHPEFARFESFILLEVAELIKNDLDGVIDPWQELLEKGFKQFQEKFKETVKNRPELLEGAIAPSATEKAMPLLEGASTRSMPEALPSFTREQIAKMSINEFLENEEAIEKALKLKRIR